MTDADIAPNLIEQAGKWAANEGLKILPLLWGDQTTVREHLGDGFSKRPLTTLIKIIVYF